MIICKRPVHLDDHLQEAFDVGVVVGGGGGCGVLFRRRRKTKKEREENIWIRKINGDANQPTNQLTDRANIVQSAFSKDGK